MPHLLEHIRAGRIDAKGIITHRMSLEQAPKAYELFEKKLLSVALCTETLAAGINLPARSVVLTTLVKGPFGKEKLIDPSTAHQIFGRAGRPLTAKDDGTWVCPATGTEYTETDGRLTES